MEPGVFNLPLQRRAIGASDRQAQGLLDEVSLTCANPPRHARSTAYRYKRYSPREFFQPVTSPQAEGKHFRTSASCRIQEGYFPMHALAGRSTTRLDISHTIPSAIASAHCLSHLRRTPSPSSQPIRSPFIIAQRPAKRSDLWVFPQCVVLIGEER